MDEDIRRITEERVRVEADILYQLELLKENQYAMRDIILNDNEKFRSVRDTMVNNIEALKKNTKEITDMTRLGWFGTIRSSLIVAVVVGITSTIALMTPLVDVVIFFVLMLLFMLFFVSSMKYVGHIEGTFSSLKDRIVSALNPFFWLSWLW